MTLAGDWSVIQAEAHGVTGTRHDGTGYLARRLDTVAPGGWTSLVRPPAGVEACRTLEFARGEVGAGYGFVTIAALAIEKVTPDRVHLPFRRPGSWICSALVAEALRFGGWYERWPDVYDVDPAQLLHALLLAGGQEIDVEGAQPGDVGFGHSKGLLGASIRLAQRIDREADWRVNHAFILDRRNA